MHRHDHRSVTYEKDGQIIGFTYYAPTAMTDRGWHLYWIAVSKQTQARGVGGQLLRYAEEDIRKAGGRQLLIETSSLPHYELTRRLYLKHGYEQVCALPDYYADGDDMVVFRKRLSSDLSSPAFAEPAFASRIVGSKCLCFASRSCALPVSISRPDHRRAHSTLLRLIQ